MANTAVFRGNMATLQLATVANKAGELGGKIFNDEYNTATVGRVTGLEFRVETDLEVFHEIGTRMPTQIVPGNVNISGKVERAFINGALFRLLMASLGSDTPDNAFPLELQPTFNLVVDLTQPGSPTATEGVKMTLSTVRFDDWNMCIPEDDFVMENMTFKALRIVREEKT
jgi:hypothetical protein